MLKRTADQTGIIASALCAAHCAVGAFLVGLVGTGHLVFSERLEQAFAGVAVVIAAGALVQGYLTHRSRLPLALGAVGILLISASRLLEFDVAWAESTLSISGALTLVSAHVVNLRARRQAHLDCCPRT